MLGVLADGSTIYPSALLQPTPRYDTGVLFASAQDPVRKDVLEMLLRLFDREDLQLIPMVEFAAPLPELEALRRGGDHAADGIEWIGAEGTSLCNSLPPQRGLAPYYNVLDPRVQQAMLGVLRELISRYARHPSLTGVAVRLSADGYAQLPGPDWGLDDATIARFERDAKLQVPGYGPQRFAQRAAFLGQEPQRRAWLEWRAAQLAKFYRRAYDELAAIRPGSRLYLAGAGMIGGPELDRDLRPSLPHPTTVASALLRVGIDARHYRDEQQRIVLLRPERIAAGRKPRQPRRRPRNQPNGRHRPLLPDAGQPRQSVFPSGRARSTSNRSTARAPSSRPTRGWFRSRRPPASRTGGGSSTAWPRSTRK